MTYKIWNLPTWDEFDHDQIVELVSLESAGSLDELLGFNSDIEIDNLDGLWEVQRWFWKIRKTLWPDALNRKALRVHLRHIGTTGYGQFPVISVVEPGRGPFSDEELRLDGPPNESTTLIEKNFSDSAWLHMLAEESGRLFGWSGFSVEEISFTDHEPIDLDDDEVPYENSFTAVSTVIPEFGEFLDWSKGSKDVVGALLAKLIVLEGKIKEEHSALPIDSYDIQLLLSADRTFFK